MYLKYDSYSNHDESTNSFIHCKAQEGTQIHIKSETKCLEDGVSIGSLFFQFILIIEITVLQ